MVGNITYPYVEKTKNDQIIDDCIDRQKEKMIRFPLTCARGFYYATALTVLGVQTLFQESKDIFAFIAVAVPAVAFTLSDQLHVSMDKSRENLNLLKEKAHPEQKTAHFFRNASQLVQTSAAAAVTAIAVMGDVRPSHMLLMTSFLLLGEMLTRPSREEFEEKDIVKQWRKERQKEAFQIQ